MAHAKAHPVPCQAAQAPFHTQLATGQLVRIERLGPDSLIPSAGDPVIREVGSLIRDLLSISPAAAEASGISLPAAWVARSPEALPDQDLGIAWWTAVPWSGSTAIAEIVLAAGMAGQGLGRVLLDLLVLSATECGREWLQVRLPSPAADLDAAVRRLHGRPVAGDPGRVEIPLGPGHRRYHRSGFHRSLRSSTRTTT